MSGNTRIQVTKNYRLFHRRAGDNRELEPEKKPWLRASMANQGFWPWSPILCSRDKKGNLYVKAGQHRLHFAEELGLSVYWQEVPESYDPANAARLEEGGKWSLENYAQRFAAGGIDDYREAMDFAATHGVSMGLAATMLSGCVGMTPITVEFKSGRFKVRARELANAVVSLYTSLSAMSKAIRNMRFCAACTAVCRVPEFEPNRLLKNAQRCRDKLVPYSTRDAFLVMLEEIYNYGQSSQRMFGLRTAANAAMRERNPATKTAGA